LAGVKQSSFGNAFVVIRSVMNVSRFEQKSQFFVCFFLCLKSILQPESKHGKRKSLQCQTKFQLVKSREEKSEALFKQWASQEEEHGDPLRECPNCKFQVYIIFSTYNLNLFSKKKFLL
jgi:hypothetical protein